MKEIIDILRQRLVLAMSLQKHVVAQRKALKAVDDSGIRRITREIDPLLVKMGALDKKQERLLGNLTFAQWLERQSDSAEKQMALKLLSKLNEKLLQLKTGNSGNMDLLQRNIKFIDYNVNVMTQTSADVTYGAPQGYGAGPVQGRKMFDTGV